MKDTLLDYMLEHTQSVPAIYRLKRRHEGYGALSFESAP